MKKLIGIRIIGTQERYVIGRLAPDSSLPTGSDRTVAAIDLNPQIVVHYTDGTEETFLDCPVSVLWANIEASPNAEPEPEREREQKAEPDKKAAPESQPEKKPTPENSDNPRKKSPTRQRA